MNILNMTAMSLAPMMNNILESFNGVYWESLRYSNICTSVCWKGMEIINQNNVTILSRISYACALLWVALIREST